MKAALGATRSAVIFSGAIALALLIGCSSAADEGAVPTPALDSQPTTEQPTTEQPTTAQPVTAPVPTTPPLPIVAPSTGCRSEAPVDTATTLIDLDQDGVDELLHVTPPPGTQRFAEATLFGTDANGCPTTALATGQSFGSAGSPEGFGCQSDPNGGLSFIDWEQASFTYSKDGVDTTSMSLITWRRTRLENSSPLTTSHHVFSLSDAREGIDPCVEETRRVRAVPSGIIGSFTPFNQIYARPSGRCTNSHLSITPPAEWFSIQVEPDGTQAGDREYRCSFFSPAPFGAPLQCDCYLPITIDFAAEETLQTAVGSGTIVRQETVDGFDAVVVEESVASDLFGDFERWLWHIDKGNGIVTIEGSTAESAMPIAELAELVDQMAATATVHNVAPPDRACARDPGNPTIGPTFYLDLDGDGTLEALAPHAFDRSGTGIVTVHRVLAARGSCDWEVLQELPRDNGLTGRQWECVIHQDGLRIRARLEPTGSQDEQRTATIWAGGRPLQLTTDEAMDLEATPCG